MLERITRLGYCPKCKSPLLARKRVDIFTRGLTCTKGHHFFVPIRRMFLHQQGGEMREDSTNDREIARAWLTKRRLRSHLNDSLAEVLEFFLDDEETMEAASQQSHTPNSNCPLCGEKLIASGAEDWGLLYRCERGHDFGERGNTLSTEIDGVQIDLRAEMSPDFFSQVVESFMTKQNMQRVMPNQIRELLPRIRNSRTQ